MIMYRIEKLEFLDEGGLLIQLLRHYCISIGYNDKSNIGQYMASCSLAVVAITVCM